jgi:hypothetical protein
MGAAASSLPHYDDASQRVTNAVAYDWQSELDVAVTQVLLADYSCSCLLSSPCRALLHRPQLGPACQQGSAASRTALNGTRQHYHDGSPCYPVAMGSSLAPQTGDVPFLAVPYTWRAAQCHATSAVTSTGCVVQDVLFNLVWMYQALQGVKVEALAQQNHQY